MATVNYPNPGTDPTVRVLDDFYNRELVIDQNAYDSVYSFFASIFGVFLSSFGLTLSLRFLAHANFFRFSSFIKVLGSFLSSFLGILLKYIFILIKLFKRNGITGVF